MILKHTSDNGCNIQLDRTEYSTRGSGKVERGKVDIFYCYTHEVETCHCGIEWGSHTAFYNQLKNEVHNLPTKDGEQVV